MEALGRFFFFFAIRAIQAFQAIQARNFEGLISTPLRMLELQKFTRIAGIDKKRLDCNN